MITLQLPKNIPYHFTEQSFSTKVLYPEEQIFIKDFEIARLEEFCTGRYCAHKCLEDLQRSAPVIKQVSGAPQWPQYTVGSISHSQKLTGAIVASTDQYSSIGLDIETVGRINSELWKLLFTANEIALLRQQPIAKHNYLSTLFFSLKEAYYKMLFPFTQSFMDFHDCEIVKLNGKYDLKILKEDFIDIDASLNYQTHYTNHENQVITYITALN